MRGGSSRCRRWIGAGIGRPPRGMEALLAALRRPAGGGRGLRRRRRPAVLERPLRRDLRASAGVPAGRDAVRGGGPAHRGERPGAGRDRARGGMGGRAGAPPAMPDSEFEHRLDDGRWIRVEEKRTRDGLTVGIRVDITELKRREASFRLLFEANPVPILVRDRDSFRFLAVNDAALRLFGYGRATLLTLRVARPLRGRALGPAAGRRALALRAGRRRLHGPAALFVRLRARGAARRDHGAGRHDGAAARARRPRPHARLPGQRRRDHPVGGLRQGHGGRRPLRAVQPAGAADRGRRPRRHARPRQTSTCSPPTLARFLRRARPRGDADRDGRDYEFTAPGPGGQPRRIQTRKVPVAGALRGSRRATCSASRTTSRSGASWSAGSTARRGSTT